MARKSSAATSCSSVHAAPAQVGYEPVEWSLSVPRADRIRVRAYTCTCQSVVYELCASAGAAFVRRYCHDGDTVTVWESAWVRSADGEELWAAILKGLAC